MSFRRLLILVAAAAFLLPVAAGAGGGTSATLVASPNPVGEYQPFTLSGCGYEPDGHVQIAIDQYGPFFEMGTGADGCLIPTSWYGLPAGVHEIDAYQQKSSKLRREVASTTLVVQ